MELVIIKSRGDQITSVTTLRKLGQFSPIDLILINPCFTDQKLARDHQSLCKSSPLLPTKKVCDHQSLFFLKTWLHIKHLPLLLSRFQSCIILFFVLYVSDTSHSHFSIQFTCPHPPISNFRCLMLFITMYFYLIELKIF